LEKYQHWFWSAVKKQRRIYAQIIVASICINLFALASAFFVMTVYDRVIPNNAMETLVSLTAGIALVLAFDFMMKTLRSIFTDRAGQNIDNEISGLIFDRISRNESLLTGFSAGAVASRIKEFDSVKDVLASATLVTFVDLPFIFLFILVLYMIGGSVVLVPLLVVIMVIGTGLLVQPLVKRLVSRADSVGHDKHSVLVELLSGLEVVKTLRGIDSIKERWNTSVASQGESMSKSRFWAQFSSNVAQSGQQISQVAIVVYGVILIAESGLTMGGLIACVILSGRTLAPLGQVSNLLGRLNHAISSYRSMNALMTLASEEQRREGFLRHSKICNAINIEGLDFGYRGNHSPIFEALNLKIEANEKVALLGPVGSGKSTLVKILSGVLSSARGTVRLGDINLAHIHPDDLRRTVAVVNQTPVLFSGTLRENILFGAPDASDDEVVEICRLTGVHEIADGLEKGYDTYLSERGAQLSGGQKQLVSIARALIGKPSVLIMDEPTSSLDNLSEERLLKNIKSHLTDVTVIVVTHRSSVLSICERVVVIDKGVVIKDVPKEELFKGDNRPSRATGEAGK